MALRHTFCALLLTASCASPVDQNLEGARGTPLAEPAFRAAQDANRGSLAPMVDHHKHMPSPAAARLVRGTQPITADQLIAELDGAGIRQAVVLSLAYWFGMTSLDPLENEYGMVRAENDWTVQQTRRFPDRLVPFCSFNPLKTYALAELDRCAASLRVRGLKLHFNSSAVDLLASEHVEKVRQIFRAANERQLPIVVHVRGSLTTYGREHAETFLNAILPAANSIPVQIVHLWGGEGFSDSALAVYAAAVSRGDPRTKNLYFDVADIARWVPRFGQQRTVAERIRQIGLKRILWGSDMAPPNPPARESWAVFQRTVPLTIEELRTIGTNVAPYLR
jgi:predicted TIM-barrel fold metal-dependent hydrolase